MRVRFLAAAAAAALSSACDPVVSNEINALGGEAPGVRKGPLHRPGQPCLLCHDGALGDPPQFTVAGTIYEDPVSMLPANGASVLLTDAHGSMETTMTNAAGNFYLTPSDWNPTFPLTVLVEANVTLTMQSEIGRDGSCAGCHVSPAGPASPGPVVLRLADGGTPP